MNASDNRNGSNRLDFKNGFTLLDTLLVLLILGIVGMATLFGSQDEADKETFSFKGQNYTPILAINDASGGVGGLLELNVTVDPVMFKTLKAEY